MRNHVARYAAAARTDRAPAPPTREEMLPDLGGPKASWAMGRRSALSARTARAGAGPSGVSAHTPKAGTPRPAVSEAMGRVEMWRGCCRPNISVAAPFVWRCLSGLPLAPFPHPAHRTGHADFPHPALGQDFTPSPTARRARARSVVRARSARTGARVDTSRPCVA